MNCHGCSTHKMMLKVFERNGLVVLNPLGDKFDPNLVRLQSLLHCIDNQINHPISITSPHALQHEALVQVPDPSKANGTVAFVQKCGYVLRGRVVRAATVGIVKN